MELNTKDSKELANELAEIRDQRDKLEMRLKELCNSPFIKEHEDRVNLRVQLRELEADIQKLRSENQNYKDIENRTSSKIELLEKQLDKEKEELKAKISENSTLK